MPILNNDDVYLIQFGNAYLRGARQGWAWNNLPLPEFNHKQYWFIQIHNASDFTEQLFRSVIPEEILNSIINGSITLLLHNYPEGFLHIVEPLYKVCIGDLGIKEEHVVLLTGARDIIPEVKRVAALTNKKEIKVYWNLEFEFYQGNKEKNNKTSVAVNTSYNFHKKYINLNRRWRFHRLVVISYLIVNDLIEDGYVSLIETDFAHDNWKNKWDSFLHQYKTFFDMFFLHKERITSSTPLTVDTDNLDNNPAWHQPELNYLYQNSYFSIVNETFFENRSTRFFTEKTFKPICNKHPFVLVAPSGSLSCLHLRGYKSFSPFINEEYDNEINDEKRLLMVCEEIKRLCTLSEVDLKIFVDGTREICEHNYITLLKNAESGVFAIPLN